LLLYTKAKSGSRKEFCYPEGDILKVKVNTYQLRKQKDAVQALQEKPVSGHERLINLFEDRERVIWTNPKLSKKEVFWQVLKEASRDGATEQREFVQKALQTPDFAILEGPPGSGKTTVILELICQLVMQGKRILLCGSTHVAIDNVLERLQEKKLLEKLAILPVRIGDENRISPAIKGFQLNNLQNDARIGEDLLLEASNLVCGTTIGILQHPDMKQFEGRWEEKAKMPIEPQFDYLIIDECSKTTFHEFLVPALYARHWILVGDVRQLSPFTDREQLVSNIERMPLKGNQTLPEELQAACMYLYKLREMTKKQFNSCKYIFVVSQRVLEYIADEWLAFDPGNDFSGTMIGFASSNLLHIKATVAKLELRTKRKQWAPIVAQPHSADWVALAAADVVFVEQETYKLHGDHFPADMTVVNDAKWTERSHGFRVSSHTIHLERPPYSKDRGKELNGTMAIHDYYAKLFAEKSWADEIAWRIDREHQLRLKDPKNTQRLTKAIDELLPKSLGNEGDVANRLNTIAAVALPSILEMLDRGLQKRKSEHISTLTEGFNPEERKSRRTLLRYQQRMHPEISAFPRAQFYNNEALQDMDKMAERRDWSYAQYDGRSAWIDVQGKTDRNCNNDEVKAMKRELQRFLDWASDNPPPDDGRDNKAEWEVACLTFYRGQEGKIRDMLREMLKHNGTHNENAFSSFSFQKRGGVKISIKLHTVDKFQGQEADLVFLSMVQTYRDGFMDSPNRLNVAITRARYQMVILGSHGYFAEKSYSEDLQKLARHHSRNVIPNQ
jgi:DNA polymerase III delta prime subunit